MASQQSQPFEQSQRIQVEMDRHRAGQLVKIRVEHHDQCLGWYTAAALSFPLHQLPLLEEAIAEMRVGESADDSLEGKIIQFPGAVSQ